MLCDMHTHSVFSDGTFTPEEIVAEAKKLGLGAVALCDHNTVRGLPDFLAAGKKYKIITVPAVELSVSYEKKEIHIIGMFIDENRFDTVTKFTEKYRILKEQSNIKLINKLFEKGYNINYEELKHEYGENINRAHIAAKLAETGRAKTIKEAFETVLSKSYGLYEPPKKLSAFDALKFFSSIGAVSVLAHPFLNFTQDELERFLPKAKNCGLDGLETRYPLFDSRMTEAAVCLAKRYSLAESGGSDFHGANKPDIKLAIGKGSLEAPFEFYEKLRDISKEKRRIL